MSDGTARTSWGFLTNHAHVLLCLMRDPSVRLRDVASMVGITERAAQSIVGDLAAQGYVSRTRIGRRNHYEVHRDAVLRPHDSGSLTVGGLLDFLQSAARTVRYPQPAMSRLSTAN